MAKEKFPLGIIFDLDGTLIDSAPEVREAFNTILIKDGRRELSLDEVVSMIGDGAPKLIERGYEATGLSISSNQKEMAVENFLSVYERNSPNFTTIFPGTIDMLDNLKKKGIKLAICSNKPSRAANKVLSDLKLKSYFEIVVGGDSLNGIRKPDPRHLLAAITPLGVEVNSTLMVGDSSNDIVVAKKAGVNSVAVSFGYTSIKASDLGADATISHFDDLIPVLDLFN